MRRSVNRRAPFGFDHWQAGTVEALDLQQILRRRGQPREAEGEPAEIDDAWQLEAK